MADADNGRPRRLLCHRILETGTGPHPLEGAQGGRSRTARTSYSVTANETRRRADDHLVNVDGGRDLARDGATSDTAFKSSPGQADGAERKT
jgi:hypothetical protein